MQRHGEPGAEMKSDVEIEIEIGGSVRECHRRRNGNVKSGREWETWIVKVRMNRGQTEGTERQSDPRTGCVNRRWTDD